MCLLKSILYDYGLGRGHTGHRVGMHFRHKPCSIAFFCCGCKDAVKVRYVLVSFWNQKRRMDEITFQMVAEFNLPFFVVVVVYLKVFWGTVIGQSLPKGLHVDSLQQSAYSAVPVCVNVCMCACL